MKPETSLFVRKLTERCAFEKMAVRLYEMLFDKLRQSRRFDEGPTMERLLTFRNEELNNLQLLCSTMLMFGADPKQVPPCEWVRGVSAATLEKVLASPHTDMVEALHVMLIAEVEDHDAWVTLAELCAEVGPPELARQFAKAARDEEAHVAAASQWLEAIREASVDSYEAVASA